MPLINDTNRCYLALLTGFVIPISTALTHVFCLLVLLFVLFQDNSIKKLKNTLLQPITLTGLLLFCIGLIGLLYSTASLQEATGVLKKYREFFYIPMFFIFFQNKKSRTWGLYGFLGAMGFTLFIAYFVAITGYGSAFGRLEEGGVFKSYITQNILMALATYFILAQYSTFAQSRWKWPLVFIIVLALYNIFFVSLGRTGYLILFALIALLFFQAYQLRGILIAGLLIILLTALLYTNSQVFQDRVKVIASDLQRYEQGDVDTSNSIGTRLEFYRNSLLLIKKHPLVGTGTGSFSSEYNIIADEKNIQHARHPHNEFLMIAVQWGAIGLILFFYLFFCLWKFSWHLEKPRQFMAQGLTITILIGCLFNSLWLDTTEGHMFAYLIGLLYSESS